MATKREGVVGRRVAEVGSGVRATALVLSGRRRIFYGWWVMAGSLLAVGIASGVPFWSFGLFIKPVEEQFGWSRAEVSLGASIALLVSGLVSPFVGKWTDHWGARSVILVGAIIAAGGYALLSTTSALWQWYLYWGVVGVSIAMTFFIPFNQLAARWFRRRRGVAVGLLAVGISLGGFMMVPVMRAVIDAFNWDGAFIFAGALLLGYFLPLGLLVRSKPADIGAEVDGGAAPVTAEEQRAAVPGGVSLSVAIRTPLFWVLAPAIGLFFFSVYGWTVHAVPFYESVGVSKDWAVALVSITAGVGMFSRLIMGHLTDHVRHFEVMAMGIAALGVLAMVTLLIDAGPAGLVVFTLLWIWANSGPPLLEPLSLTRAFGVAHFGTILGVMALIRIPVQVSAPTAAGAVFDRTGSYDWALVMFLCTFAGSLLLFFVAMRLPKPIHARPAQEARENAAGGR